MVSSINNRYLFFQLAEVTENLTRVSSEYDVLLAEKEQTERIMNEHVCQEPEKIALLNQEKDELQQMVEVSKAERDQLEADCQESKERVCIKISLNLCLKDMLCYCITSVMKPVEYLFLSSFVLRSSKLNLVY